MMRNLLILCVLLILCGCSGLSTSEDINESLIIELLEDIRISFIQADLEAIMDHYHLDYFHNGDFIEDARARWVSRLVDFVDLEIEDLEIDINGNFAVAEFEFTLYTETENYTWQEPSEKNGDLSYLFFNGNEWQIYGNQIAPD